MEEDAAVAITAPLAYAPTLPGAQPPYRHAAYGSTVKRAPLRPPMRLAHIHLSVFGPAFATRLITQMYFPGDPLLDLDPIFQSTADAEARARLISRYDPNLSEAEYALGYRFDIVLRGRAATPMEA